MEDYEFSLRMKERGIPIRLLPGRIITSGRRYRKGFPLFTMWNMYRLRQMYRPEWISARSQNDTGT